MLDLTQQQPVRSPADALRPARFPFVARLLGKTLAWGYRLAGKDRYDDFRLEWVRGAPFVVMPSVFNPKVPRTGEFLASQIDAGRIGCDWDVLDMGTGSGVCAVIAARYARRVVAVDINIAAVRCARVNAILNHLEHRIDVRHGDLFTPLSGERFDLILFNPPFKLGTPRDDRDRAWRSNDIAARFAAGVADHLKPGGCALLVLSSFGDAPVFFGEFHQRGLHSTVLAERRFVNEKLAIFRVTPAEEARLT